MHPTVFGSVVEGSGGGRLFQQTDDFLVARFGGHSQSSSAASVRVVRVGASKEQRLDAGNVALLSCNAQGGGALAAGVVNFGVPAQQQLHNCGMALQYNFLIKYLAQIQHN